MPKKNTQFVSLGTYKNLEKKEERKNLNIFMNQIMFCVTLKSLLFVQKENFCLVALYINVPKNRVFIMKYRRRKNNLICILKEKHDFWQTKKSAFIHVV